MIAVCPKHIRNGLKTLYLPHVDKVDEKSSGSFQCHFCRQKGDFKLFNYSSPSSMKKQRKTVG